MGSVGAKCQQRRTWLAAASVVNSNTTLAVHIIAQRNKRWRSLHRTLRHKVRHVVWRPCSGKCSAFAPCWIHPCGVSPLQGRVSVPLHRCIAVAAASEQYAELRHCRKSHRQQCVQGGLDGYHHRTHGTVYALCGLVLEVMQR